MKQTMQRKITCLALLLCAGLFCLLPSSAHAGSRCQALLSKAGPDGIQAYMHAKMLRRFGAKRAMCLTLARSTPKQGITLLRTYGSKKLKRAPKTTLQDITETIQGAVGQCACNAAY